MVKKCLHLQNEDAEIYRLKNVNNPTRWEIRHWNITFTSLNQRTAHNTRYTETRLISTREIKPISQQILSRRGYRKTILVKLSLNIKGRWKTRTPPKEMKTLAKLTFLHIC